MLVCSDDSLCARLALSAAGCAVFLHPEAAAAPDLRALSLDLRGARLAGGVRALRAALMGCGPRLTRLALRLPPNASWVRDSVLPGLLDAIAVGAPQLADLWLDASGSECTVAGVGRAVDGCTALWTRGTCHRLRLGVAGLTAGPGPLRLTRVVGLGALVVTGGSARFDGWPEWPADGVDVLDLDLHFAEFYGCSDGQAASERS